jgi:hypothetical protein
LLGDFKARVSKEGIIKPTIGNESLHEISDDNGVVVVNFDTSKNLAGKVRISHIATFINILGRFQIGKRTIRFTTF